MEEIVKVKVTEALKKHLHPDHKDKEEVEIVVKGISYGQYKSCRKSSIVIKPVGKTMQQFRDMDLYDDLEMVASVKSCPFDKTIENFHRLDIQDGTKLSEVVNRVNSPPKIEDGSEGQN